MEAEKQADSLDEEEVAIVMEIAEVIGKISYQLLEIRQRKKLLKETAEVAKVLTKFQTHSITNTNELFYAGAVVVTKA